MGWYEVIVRLVAGGLGLAAGPLLGLFVLAAIAGGAAGGSGAAAGHATFNPSEEAIADIPPGLIDLYASVSTSCVGLRWQVLAGIARVESDHGRFGGAATDVKGDVRPRIIGIALDGTHGTAVISDTDAGELDGDVVWDRAVGPFQFIPSSWAIFGVDAAASTAASAKHAANATPRAACVVPVIAPWSAVDSEGEGHRRRVHLASRGRATRTGQWASCTTRMATLPMTRRRSPVLPWVVRAISPAPLARA